MAGKNKSLKLPGRDEEPSILGILKVFNGIFQKASVSGALCESLKWKWFKSRDTFELFLLRTLWVSNSETSPSGEHFGSTHQWHRFEIGLPVTEGQGLSGLRELWLPLDVSLAGGFCCHKDFSCLKKNKEILKTQGMKLGQMARNDMHFFMGVALTGPR